MTAFDRLVMAIEQFLDSGRWDASPGEQVNRWRMHAYGMMAALSVVLDVSDVRQTGAYDALWRRIDAKFRPSWLQPPSTADAREES